MLPANHDEVADRTRTGGDGKGVRAHDHEAVALVEPAGAVIFLPDAEKDVRRRPDAGVGEGGVEQSSSDSAALNGRLHVEAPEFVVAGGPAGRLYLDCAKLRITDRMGIDFSEQKGIG